MSIRGLRDASYMMDEDRLTFTDYAMFIIFCVVCLTVIINPMSITGSTKGTVSQKLVSLSGVPSQIVSGGTGTNFTIDLGTNLQLIKGISWVTVTFPNNVYNIYNDNRGQNNVYSYRYNSNPVQTFTVTPGFYNIGSLLNVLNQDLSNTTAGAGFWSFNPNTGLATLNVQSGSAITLNPTGGTTNTGLMTTLGGGSLLTSNLIVNNPGLVNVTGTTFPQLTGLTHAHVLSSVLAPANMVEGPGGVITNTGLCVPVTVPFGSLNTFECKQDDLCEINYSRARDCSKIDIKLTDRRGNILDLHGGHVHVVLRVWFNTF